MEPETVLPSCCLSSRLPLKFSKPRSSSQSVPGKTTQLQRQTSEPALRTSSLSSLKRSSINERNQDALLASRALVTSCAFSDDFSYPKSSLRKLSLQERRKIFEMNNTGDQSPQPCNENISEEGQDTPETEAGIGMTWEAASCQHQKAAGRQDLTANMLISCTPEAKLTGGDWKQANKFGSSLKAHHTDSKIHYSRGAGTLDVRQRISSFESLASQKQSQQMPATSHEKKTSKLSSCSSLSVKKMFTDEANEDALRQRGPLTCDSSDQMHILVEGTSDKISVSNSFTKQETLGKTQQTNVTSENNLATNQLERNSCEYTELPASFVMHDMTISPVHDKTEVVGACNISSEIVTSEKSEINTSEKEDMKSEGDAEMSVLGSNYSECCKASYISDASKIKQNDLEKIKSEVTVQVSQAAEMCSSHSSLEKETAKRYLGLEDGSEVVFEPSFIPNQRSSSPVPEDEFASESYSEEKSLEACESTPQLPAAMMDLSSPLAPHILLDCYDDKHDSDGSVVTTPSDLSQLDMRSFSIRYTIFLNVF
ncbi:uncharacterized protein LOC122808412 [Protopterus annectens]|uniref:uncharacterized protein LOC122808412 n=1 Tax=Protopterus annectens TaxID=7888 RepID=UPI001CF94FCA|nr:uncharacterized protein LOC122808412 [Protopterus annectens]